MTWRAIPLNLGDNIGLGSNVVLGSDGNMWTVAAWNAGSFTLVGVANNDQFAPVITAVSGTPDGLSLTFYFAVTS